MFVRIFIALLLILTALNASAQERSILLRQDTTFSDTLTIVSWSALPVETGANIIILPDGKTFEVENVNRPFRLIYHVLPFDLSSKIYRRSLAVYDSGAYYEDKSANPSELTSTSGWINSGDISHQGAITRGITVGNSQSLTMQSRMNLQLEGKLNDDLNIAANITDQQVPFLPEGNSQYLREFDNVSITLYNEKFTLEAGDQLWVQNNTAFGNYSRNVEGARLTLSRATEKGKFNTSFGAASARGKFAREFLEIEDGVLGPYRIPRPAASANVVILPGTERVFLDGMELLRGVENDYVIDYMQGEITFTPDVIITRFSRVIIEFEYTLLSYQQTTLMGRHSYESEKFNYFISFFRQQDNNRQPLGLNISTLDLQELALQGQEDNMIITPAIDSVGRGSGGIFYARKDTVTSSGQVFTIYYHSKNPDEAYFRLSFRENDKGNYIVKEFTAEGRVYEWIAPVNGIPQGNYEPEVLISAPETQQLVTIGGSVKINQYDKFSLEYNNSGYQANNFRNQDPDHGNAFVLTLSGSGRPLGFLEKYKLNHTFEIQYLDESFNPLERIRSVEFERLWLSPDSLQTSDLMISGTVRMEKSPQEYLSYMFIRRNRGDLEGWSHQVESRQKVNNFLASGNLNFTSSSNSLRQSDWFNYTADISYKAGNWQPGARIIAERNGVYNGDSLMGSANNFIDRQLYIKREIEKEGSLNILYSHRHDFLPNHGEFAQLSKANMIMANAEYKNLDLRVNYRTLEITGDNREEVLAGDLTHRWRPGKVYEQTFGYGISQGRELRRVLQYMQVAPGEGTHAWRDLDGDNVKDIDEFFEAINIDERNYVKILMPTDEFVPAYETRMSYRGSIKAPTKWKESSGLVKLLSRLRADINFVGQQKTNSESWDERLLPVNSLNNQVLISEKMLVQSRLILARTSEKFGGSITYGANSRKQLFQVGIQENGRDNFELDILYMITPSVEIGMNGGRIEEYLINGFSEQGSYAIKGYDYSPRLIFSPNMQWRFTSSLKIQDLISTDDESAARHNQFGLNVKHHRNSSFITADFRIIDIDFRGEENTGAGYALLNAMRPGINHYWQLNLQQKLTGTLRMSIFYDGRKSEDAETIHIGRIQLTALF